VTLAVNLFFFSHQPLQQAEILLIAVGREIEVAGNANKLLLFNRLFMLFHERLIGPPAALIASRSALTAI
jgi:hypothetical protein